MKKKAIITVLLTTTLSLAGCSDKANSDQTATNATSVESIESTAINSESSIFETADDTETLTQISLQSTTFPLPTTVENADIYVAPIPDLSDNFIRGMDVSSILAEEKSGVKYLNADGVAQDVFTTMAEAGVNYARIRIWNDPYDENGNGYGGGNNDLATAIELGKRATENGMKVCIDFHYSDFWADPAKQMCPKAWVDLSLEEKSDALYQFTKDSLTQLLENGVDVSMIQVGNETNNGMAGETQIPNIAKLMNSGSKAVREVSKNYDKDIKVALHYTNANDYDGIDSILYKLSSFQVDYDIFALSYYPYWHGTFDNLQKVMENIQEKYGKETLIAETAYCYTTKDTDGSGNSVGETDLIDGYGATVQSQSTALRDVCATANDAGALGVFYWEGAWIAVGDATANNSPIWEEFGSGWASSYAATYDPNDAGKYYGGCSWDNQALFGADGKPLESLNTFKWLKYGTNAEPAIDLVLTPTVTCNIGDQLQLPETVDVIYNNRTLNTALPIEWYEEQVKNIDTSKAGTYEIDGKILDDAAESDKPNEACCIVTVELHNYVINPSFEDSDTSMWKISYEGDKNPTDFQQKETDAHTGEYAFHFWSESDMDFSIEQEFSNLEPGTYELKAYFQGGDIDETAQMELYASIDETFVSDPFTAQGYANWQEPTISSINVIDGTLKVGIRIQCNAKGWGTIDDITLHKIN
ncbi:arabinogalactan endo-beta-1,4-galactanase [Lachnospiraceae bacterium]|nr:arabinogalactan endo-beta-1,4-galactanase [Lachnospiraceae bacterium]